MVATVIKRAIKLREKGKNGRLCITLVVSFVGC